jgi:hypothetical protein
MSEHIRKALERERHNAALWRDLRPEESARSDVRAYALEQELGAAFREEMEILLAYEQSTTPEPAPQTFLIPLGMDEYLMSVSGERFIYDDETHLRRPLETRV